MDTKPTHRRRRTEVRRALRIALVLLGGCASAPEKVGSIGAVLSRDTETGAVEIHEVPPGLAADRAGLYAGDDIKMIDGVLIDDLDAARIQHLLRGPVGSTVMLTVIRSGEVLEIEVERQALASTTAKSERHERIE